MNLEFSVNNNPVDIYYTTYNPLSGYSIPGYQCFYYLLTPTYSNFWTINVTPVTPGNTVKLYFVLIGHPGPGGSSNTEYESSGGGGATGAMGEGSISFNSNMALNLTLTMVTLRYRSQETLNFVLWEVVKQGVTNMVLIIRAVMGLMRG